MEPPSLTIGIEEKYQVVDPESGELERYISEILDEDVEAHDALRPELHASTVEVATLVCESVAEAREEIICLRRQVSELAAGGVLGILAAGSHPISSWEKQEIIPLARSATRASTRRWARSPSACWRSVSTFTWGSRTGSSWWTP